MAVLADISVPVTAFALGGISEEAPDASIECERVVPLDGEWPLLCHVQNDEADVDAIEVTLREQRGVARVERFADTEDGTLLVVHLDPTADSLIDALASTNVYVLAAEGDRDCWEFTLQFADHEGLHQFNETLTEEGIPVTLRRLHNPTQKEETSLSAEQEEAVRLAYRRGYFEIPRQCTLGSLADEVGISDSAFSQRLRRGTAACVREALDLS